MSSTSYDKFLATAQRLLVCSIYIFEMHVHHTLSSPLPSASVHWLVQCTLECHWNDCMAHLPTNDVILVAVENECMSHKFVLIIYSTCWAIGKYPFHASSQKSKFMYREKYGIICFPMVTFVWQDRIWWLSGTLSARAEMQGETVYG